MAHSGCVKTKAPSVESPASEADLTQAAFAKEAEQRLKAEDPKHEWTYDAAEFAFRRRDNGERWFLANAYAEWSRETDTTAKDQLLDKSIRVAISNIVELTWQQAQSQLRPQVYSSVYLRAAIDESYLRAALGDSPRASPLFTRPAGPLMLLQLVLDWPERYQGVARTDIDRWGVSFEEALAVAQRNLISASAFTEIRPGTYISSAKDSYDAARAMTPAVFEKLNLRGRPVLVMPHRDYLAVTGDEDPEGLSALLELLEGELNHDRFISAELLRLSDESPIPSLESFVPDGPPDLRSKAIELRVLSHGTVYENQRQHLEELASKADIDIFVAKYDGIISEKSGHISYCTYPHGVDSLLPQTDLVAMIDPALPKDERFMGFIRWEDFQRLMGDRLQAIDLLPIRYRPKGFPDRAALKAVLLPMSAL